MVLALAIMMFLGAIAVAENSPTLFYGLGKIALVNQWPKLVQLLVKALAASQETVERILQDTRRRLERGVDGKERMR